MYDYEKSQRLLQQRVYNSHPSSATPTARAVCDSEVVGPTVTSANVNTATPVVDKKHSHSRGPQQQRSSGNTNNTAPHLRRSTSMHVQRLTTDTVPPSTANNRHLHHWVDHTGFPLDINPHHHHHHHQKSVYRQYSDDDTLRYQLGSSLYPQGGGGGVRRQVFHAVPRSYLQEYYPEVDTRGRSLVKQIHSCQDFHGITTNKNGGETNRKGAKFNQDKKCVNVSPVQGKKYLIRSSSGPAAGCQAGVYDIQYLPNFQQEVMMTDPGDPSATGIHNQGQAPFLHTAYLTDVDYHHDLERVTDGHVPGYTIPAEDHDYYNDDETCKEPIYENVNPQNLEGNFDAAHPKAPFWTYSGHPQSNVTHHARIMDMKWAEPTHIGHIPVSGDLARVGMYSEMVDPVWYEDHDLQQTPYVHSDKGCVDSATANQPRDSSPRISYKEREVSPTPTKKKEVKLTREKSFLFPWERRKGDHDGIKKEKDSSPQMSPRNKRRLILPWERSDSKKISGDSSPEVISEEVKPSKKESKGKKSLKLKKITKRSESEKYPDKSKHPGTAGIVRRHENLESHKRSHSDDSSHKVVRNKESSSSPVTPKSKSKQNRLKITQSTAEQDCSLNLQTEPEQKQKLHVPVYKSLSDDSVTDSSQNWCYLYWSNGEGMKLGALTKDNRSDLKKDKEKENKDADMNDSKLDTSDPAGGDSAIKQVSKRTVVVHRDARGYGLTVSGESPVFVQSVKENGAAERAGVRQWDRIIKVNGTLVTNSNHVEVVKLIRSGPYVQLTLLAKQENQVSPEKISGPTAVDKKKEKEFQTGKIATIRTFYEQVSEEYEKLRAELTKTPNNNEIKMKLEEKVMLQKKLADQLFNLTGIPPETQFQAPSGLRPSGLPPPGGTSPNKGSGELLNIQEEGPTGLPPHHPTSSPSVLKRHRKTDSVPDGSVFETCTEFSTDTDANIPRSASDSSRKWSSEAKETFSMDEMERFQGNLRMRRRIMMKKTASLPTSIQGTDLDQHSPTHSPTVSPTPKEAREAWADGTPENVEEMHFGSPDTSMTESLLGVRPSNSTGILHTPATQQAQVISMEDDDFSTDDEHLEEHGPFSDLNNLKHRPGHLAVFLYYLMSNSDPSPLLFYLVTEQYTQGNHKEMKKWAYEIYSTFLHEKAPLRVSVDEEIMTQIEDSLKHKLEKEDTLRSIFQLARHMAQNDISELLLDFRNKRALGLANLFGAQELQDDVMDKAAELKVVEKILWPEFEKLNVDSQDQSDKNQAIAMGLATFFRIIGLNQTKTDSAITRCSSFMMKDKKLFKNISRNKKGFTVRGHLFNPHQYVQATNCNHCGGLLWGAGHQGWHCQTCEYNAHKQCLEKLKDECSKKNRRSMLERLPGMRRGNTHTNATAIKEAQRLHEENQTITPPSNTEEDDDLASDSSTNSHQPRDSLLRMSSRTISLPSIIQTGAAAKRTSIYVSDTPPSTPVGKTMPRDIDESDSMRSQQGRVKGMVQTINETGRLEDVYPSPPRKSPEPSHQDLLDDTRFVSPATKAGAAEIMARKKRGIINIGRSESLNKKGEKRKSVRRTRSDVQVDEHMLKGLEPSASSSTSSLSNRSTESPSNSQEGINDSSFHSTPPLSNKSSQYYDDSDLEAEAELPSLDKVIPKELLKKLKPKDKKRQDVLNELFYTEKNHCRNLKVIHRYFFIPMSSEAYISKDLVKKLFPNLEEMITVHGDLNSAFKKKKKENPVIGDVAQIFIDRFSKDEGDRFKAACAIFCRDQSHALDLLRHRTRKDQKLAAFLQEASSNPACRRLQVQDIIPSAMQRLTKYPLLIENLMKYTSSATSEYALLEKALSLSRDVLAYVNQAVKECENHRTLEDLQKRMDKRPIENSNHPLVQEYKKLDLTKHKLIHEGALTWRINKQKQIDLQVVLLEEIVVLLQKVDDKLQLRCQNFMLVSGRDDTKFTHSPIIKVKNLMVKPVATDKKGFFLVSTPAPPQIYELVTNSTEAKKTWFKHFTDVAKLYEGKEGPTKPSRKPQPAPGPVLPPPPSGVPVSESAEQVNKVLHDGHEEEVLSTTPPVKAESDVGKIAVMEEEPELIQPDEVTVSKGIMLDQATPNEKLQQQDDIIEKAMSEKHRILAELHHLPQPDFYHIAELASEDLSKRDVSQYMMAADHQSRLLTRLVNQCLNTSIPTGTTDASRHDSNHNQTMPPPSQAHTVVNQQPQGDHPDGENGSRDLSILLPSGEIMSIANKLSEHLSQLSVLVQQREEERVQMQNQLTLLQAQVNSYRGRLPEADTVTTDLTPTTTPTHHLLPASSSPPPTPTELHISEQDVSMQSSISTQLSTSTTTSSVGNSRPVSFISVTSETSAEGMDASESQGLDEEDEQEDLASTLTRDEQHAGDNSSTKSSETSHSTSSVESSTSVEVKGQVKEITVERLQVLESISETKVEKVKRVSVLYSEGDHSSSSDTEKLEIVEELPQASKSQTVPDSSRLLREDDGEEGGHGEKKNGGLTENSEESSADEKDSSDREDTKVSQIIESPVRVQNIASEAEEQVICDEKTDSAKQTNIDEQDMLERIGETDSEFVDAQEVQTPVVMIKDTLVRNIDTTQMVTSETQTYEAVATVTDFTENIVAETVLDDENSNVEYTPEIVPETMDSLTTDGGDVGRMEEPGKHVEGAMDSEQVEGTQMVMEMDCQTEMDPELLELIEAAERIEAQQQQNQQEGYEYEEYDVIEEGSQGEEEESEEGEGAESEQEGVGSKAND